MLNLRTVVRMLSAMAAFIFAVPAQAESGVAWVGGSFTDDSDYAYVGTSYALSGDISKNGFLIRADGGYGYYEYKTNSGFGSTVIEGNSYTGGLMAGYQYFLSDAGRTTLYLGVNYENHGLGPDDKNNSVDGGKVGFKSLLELEYKVLDAVELSTAGSYSTAFGSYWTRTRAGYDFDILSFGPEFTALGNDDYDQQRYGAFVSGVKLGGNFELGFNAGYSEGGRSGDSGAYGGLTFSTLY